jgi:hypothetical protein
MKSHTAVTATLAAMLAASTAGASEVAAPPDPTAIVTPVPAIVPAGVAPTIVVPMPTLAPVPGPTTVVETPGASSVTVTCPPTQIILVPPPPPPVVVTTPPPVIVAPPQTCPACAPPPPAAPMPPPPRPVPTTELRFTSNDDEEYVISIYREDPVWDYEAQCRTPCSLHVPNGTHEFMAGAHRTFTVYALGGVQVWRVEDNNQAGIVLGSILTGVGGISGFFGALFVNSWDDSYDSWGGSGDESHYNEPAAIATGIGFGSAVLGLTIWLLSYGMAEAVLPSDGTIPLGAGLGVLPTLSAGRGETGEDRFALGLALRF